MCTAMQRLLSDLTLDRGHHLWCKQFSESKLRIFLTTDYTKDSYLGCNASMNGFKTKIDS